MQHLPHHAFDNLFYISGSTDTSAGDGGFLGAASMTVRELVFELNVWCALCSPRITCCAGESAAEGGIREAREEAGVCGISGGLRLLRVEQTDTRFRWILHCRAASDALKTEADSESNGARWVTLQECATIDSGEMQGIDHCWLRGEEPMKWFEHIAAGQPSYAMSEFVQAMTEKGAQDFHGRAAYKTSSDGRIAVIRKCSGLVAAFRETSGKRHICECDQCGSSFYCVCFYITHLCQRCSQCSRFIPTAIYRIRAAHCTTAAPHAGQSRVACRGLPRVRHRCPHSKLHLRNENDSKG